MCKYSLPPPTFKPYNAYIYTYVHIHMCKYSLPPPTFKPYNAYTAFQSILLWLYIYENRIKICTFRDIGLSRHVILQASGCRH